MTSLIRVPDADTTHYNHSCFPERQPFSTLVFSNGLKSADRFVNRSRLYCQGALQRVSTVTQISVIGEVPLLHMRAVAFHDEHTFRQTSICPSRLASAKTRLSRLTGNASCPVLVALHDAALTVSFSSDSYRPNVNTHLDLGGVRARS